MVDNGPEQLHALRLGYGHHCNIVAVAQDVVIASSVGFLSLYLALDVLGRQVEIDLLDGYVLAVPGEHVLTNERPLLNVI